MLLEGSKSYLGRGAGGQRVDSCFCIPAARQKMGCHLDVGVNARRDGRGTTARVVLFWGLIVACTRTFPNRLSPFV